MALSNPASTSMAHFDVEAASRGWYVAPDGVYRPTVSDSANMQIFTTDEFRDVSALVATLRDATPCLRGPRHVVWPLLCEAMAHWRSVHEADLDACLDAERTSWVDHGKLYASRMEGVCLAMRFSRQKWVRGLFSQLCEQHKCATAVDLAACFLTIMNREDSIVYIGFCFYAKRPYIGMVHERRPYRRWEEHWRGTLQASQGELCERKYGYMHDNGGAKSWFFVPWVSCGETISLNRLRVMEKRIIALFPNALNGIRSKWANPAPRGNKVGEAAKAKTAAAEEGDRRFNKVKVSNARKGSKVIQVQVHYMTAAGGVVVGCDLGTAMAVSDCISWHLSYPWSTLTCQRRWGRSEVVCYSDSGLVAAGSLRSVISSVGRWAVCRVYLLILRRVQHVRQLTAEDDYLLALCENEVPRHEAEDLLVQ
jgi:hypothetical protein